MRHKVYGKHLGRDIGKRKALFKNLVRSLIISETIQTTESKAKAIKGLVDKIINQAKSPNTKKTAAQFLSKKDVEEKLFKNLVPRLMNRMSGYTSIVRVGRRLGDGAMIVQMRLLLKEEQKVREPIQKVVIKKKRKEADSSNLKTQKPKVKTTSKS